MTGDVAPQEGQTLRGPYGETAMTVRSPLVSISIV
jgi:hypothetical protein